MAALNQIAYRRRNAIEPPAKFRNQLLGLLAYTAFLPDPWDVKF
jgi:hypothetical protein